MNSNDNYQDLIRKVSSFLDNELTFEAERELIQEIKTNPEFLRMLSKEASFREFIKSKIQRRKVSPSLIQAIKDKIRVNPA
ncbi:MAG: hypothetical protein KDC34_20460 [Saprospiraceae bacterium]|nr:hypothetical protein [Saprospiraceae bacterium]